MRITTYGMRLNEDRVNCLVKEASCNYTALRAIQKPGDAADILRDVCDLHNQAEEHVFMIMLSSANTVKGVSEVSHGGLAMAPILPREIFSRALLCGAAALILAHNHPSGDIRPSKQDLEETQRVCDSGELLGIRIFDHIIIGEDGYHSMLEHGHMSVYEPAQKALWSFDVMECRYIRPSN